MADERFFPAINQVFVGTAAMMAVAIVLVVIGLDGRGEASQTAHQTTSEPKVVSESIATQPAPDSVSQQANSPDRVNKIRYYLDNSERLACFLEGILVVAGIAMGIAVGVWRHWKNKYESSSDKWVKKIETLSGRIKFLRGEVKRLRKEALRLKYRNKYFSEEINRLKSINISYSMLAGVPPSAPLSTPPKVTSEDRPEVSPPLSSEKAATIERESKSPEPKSPPAPLDMTKFHERLRVALRPRPSSGANPDGDEKSKSPHMIKVHERLRAALRPHLPTGANSDGDGE